MSEQSKEGISLVEQFTELYDQSYFKQCETAQW